MTGAAEDANRGDLERYYRLHAGVYDATRWAFLFGRTAILERLARHAAPAEVLEVGCGTGRNLAGLARRLPEARLTGVDLSPHMLARARRRLAGLGERVSLVEASYHRPLAPERAPEAILFSYCLSMVNPGWEAALDSARADLAPGGLLAVADFHATPVPAFRRWMGVNHVRMEGHLLPALRARFTPLEEHLAPAYGGLWRYLLFLGRRPD